MCGMKGWEEGKAHNKPRHRGHVGTTETLDIVILQDLQAFERGAK